MGNAHALDKFFKISERGSSVKTEILAGITTFVTLGYIIFVNPAILADAGIPKEAAIAATIVATVIATLLMAFLANYPIAVAPGMGLNAFFTYTVVLGFGLHWTVALGAVFFSGVLFFILTVTKVRAWIIDAVPPSLRAAIPVGIGLFIAFIGLKSAGIVVSNEATSVGLGDLGSPEALLAIFGIIVSVVLMSLRVKGALIIGILATTVAGMIVGAVPAPKGISDIMSFKLPSLAPTFGQLDLKGALQFGLFNIIFTFTIVELFDNMGTLMGLLRKAGLMGDEGQPPELGKAFISDSIGTMTSAVVGTCTVTSYIESAAGIAEGGKTGLTAVTVAVLFILALIFAPLVGLVPGFATAPALIIVGALMLSEIVHVNFEDFTDAFPAFLMVIGMPLTYSIATGLGLGFIAYAAVKILTGRYKELHWMMYIIAILFVINFAMRLH
ncbi:putative MFS transporter, AGZA family, xanthine/uracil permease [Thermosyntropha lipolytica DSM 11003]|uniref:Putative MFS transporter, AGZA family, xanthine/uracil permease n=1 Tax=Thermosyntropha lipolytica DSM 11003 TaxID=1123382 RepID=A0A1M5MZ50_9FIRM|nr:NCS2 family permease [Thermosyntropha lipolytica]SHG82495.1 putative MFS transporter, AGZA family, xanthine/uracil permease [Thermosyntropha lipolytica DSM 11003]